MATETAYSAEDYRALAMSYRVGLEEAGGSDWEMETILSALAIAARVMEVGLIAQALAYDFSQGEQPSDFDSDEASIRAALTGGSNGN